MQSSRRVHRTPATATTKLANRGTLAQAQRRTIGEAGEVYIAHLENVMQRMRTTIADQRGYLRRHLAPYIRARRGVSSRPHSA
jgi:hypothetical protein